VLLPFRRSARILGLKAGEMAALVGDAQVEQAEQVGWAVRAAASRTPWHDSCLVQALATTAMLRRRQIPATLFLGVAKTATSSGLAAHAWVCCGDSVVIGGAERAGFTPVGAFSTPGTTPGR